ncbi:hypothetical protein ACRB68_09930 [Actinomadura sp. RB68]|uniref:Uncharacterized protein n=1 Tax=Actinomadura macrotermitis TaxID=2585200 RepID=A0A7K0BP37_9ACTN|nr:hypothetical protein [Actinomadura macrotermitis]
MSRTSELRFDPSALNAAQRHGDACVVCHKRWPRPRVRVGVVPDGTGVFACADCAPALPAPRRAARPGEPHTAARGPDVEPARTAAPDTR